MYNSIKPLSLPNSHSVLQSNLYANGNFLSWFDYHSHELFNVLASFFFSFSINCFLINVISTTVSLNIPH